MRLPRTSRLTLSTKLIPMSIAIICVFCLALTWLYPQEKSPRFANPELKVQHQTETAWGVIDFNAGLNGIFHTNLLLVALALLITAVLVFFVNRSMTSPLARIREAIFKLSQGNTTIAIDCGRPVNCSSLKEFGKY